MQLILLFLLALFSLEAKILQTNNIEDVLAYLNPSTWLVLPIDDTLLEGENQLGRAKWYDHEIQKRMHQGMSQEIAQNTFYPQWVLSQMICPVRTVELNTAAVIAKAQGAALAVLGLSTRRPSMAALTAEQLAKLHIDLSKKAPPFPLYFDGVYRNGIWFFSDSSKIEALVRLFSAMAENRPKRLVFIDEHLEELEKALEPLNIECIGIRYTKAQERPFDPAIADVQYSNLPEIFSDAEAAAILKEIFP